MNVGDFDMILSPMAKNIGLAYNSEMIFGMNSLKGYEIFLFPPRRSLEIWVTGIDDV
jgi:hypothetical protein